MAHVSGGIMAAYIAFGIEAKHLLAAVIMTAPGTILLGEDASAGDRTRQRPAARVEMAELERDPNTLGAIARGTSDRLEPGD